ncbi:hypothetical protein BC833DRAFT_579577 [Globomyces pollinis-pini]|nr:hypothetical protein BC833DRAFT_579577 [Globomyces pollinis-pini]
MNQQRTSSTHSTGVYKVDWPRYNVAVCGMMFSIAFVIEIIVLYLIVNFVHKTIGRNQAGSTFFISLYISMFVISLFIQFLWSIDARKSYNVPQLIAVACLNLLSLLYGFLGINRTNLFKTCMDLLDINGSPINSTIFAWDKFEQKCGLNLDTNQININQIHRIVVDYYSELNIALILQYIVIVVLFPLCLLEGYLAYRCYFDLGWSLFKSQGANRRTSRMISRFHLFQLFLKVNMILFLGISAQFYFAQYFEMTFATGCVYLGMSGIVTLCASFMYYLLGVYSTKYGDYVLLYTFLAVSLLVWLVLSFLFYWIHQPINSAFEPIGLSVFIVIQFICNGVVLVFGVLMIVDFDDELVLTRKFLSS